MQALVAFMFVLESQGALLGSRGGASSVYTLLRGSEVGHGSRMPLLLERMFSDLTSSVKGVEREKTRLVQMRASADMAHGLAGSGSLAVQGPESLTGHCKAQIGRAHV